MSAWLKELNFGIIFKLFLSIFMGFISHYVEKLEKRLDAYELALYQNGVRITTLETQSSERWSANTWRIERLEDELRELQRSGASTKR